MTKASFYHWLELVCLLVKKEIKIRYRSSFLGYLWSMLNPLLMMTVLTIVFSHVMRDNIAHYPLYILSGVICWNMFSQSLSSGIQSIISYRFLLNKVSVPAWVFPTAYVSTSFLNMVLALVPFSIISLFRGQFFSLPFIQLPFVLLFFILFIEGVVLSLSSLNVIFRDISHVCEPLLQLIFYASPVIYTLDLVPKKYHIFIKLNPLFYFLDAFRSCLYSSNFISFQGWALMSFLSFLSFFIGFYLYKRLKNQFMYFI